MRLFLDAIAGPLALLATLLLASPGVRLTRAADDAATSVPADRPGPVCSVDRTAGPAPNLDALLQQMRLEAIARARSEPDAAGDRPIVLNNRGYNYGPPPGVDPTVLQAELRRLPR